MFRVSVLFIALFISFQVSSQPIGYKRVEIETNIYSDNFNIIPVKENGLILLSEVEGKKLINEKKWQVSKFDVEFNQNWTLDISTLSNLKLIEYRYDNFEKIFLLFGNTRPWKGGTGIYDHGGKSQLITLNIITGKTQSQFLELPHGSVSGFYFQNNNVLISGYTLPTSFTTNAVCYGSFCLPPLLLFYPKIFKSGAYAFLINTESGTMHNYREQNKKGVNIPIGVLLDSGNIEIFAKINSEKGLIKKYIFDSGLHINNQYAAIVNSGKSINAIRAEKTDNNKQLYAGTYDVNIPRDSWGPNKITDMIETVSSGIFVGTSENDSIGNIHYHELINFYGKNIKQFSINEKGRKSDKIHFRYPLLLHPIIKTQNGFAVVAESYEKTYNTYTYMDANGFWRTTYVFDGYSFNNIFIAEFDENANLLWNNVFENSKTKSFVLKEKSKVWSEGGIIYVSYSNTETIITKSIDNGEVETTSTPIFNEAGDKVLTNYENEISYWYGKYFLASGYQKIRKTTNNENEKKKRQVFYFSKLPMNER
jgi:hypothetical protein